MVAHPDRNWNGGGRELPAGADHLNESVYCVTCGNIYVPNPHARECPTCRLAEVVEELVDGDVW